MRRNERVPYLRGKPKVGAILPLIASGSAGLDSAHYLLEPSDTIDHLNWLYS